MQVSTNPSTAIAMLESLTALPGHTFWADDVPLVVDTDGDRDGVSSHRLVTDAHLVALVVRQGGVLVTFDGALADSAPAGLVQLL
jgi:predicted nucleic acid-binding protein